MKQIKNKIGGWFDKFSPVTFFVITAALFGLLFLVITPPFQGADEEVHFYRAYQISQGNFVIDQLKTGAGGSLPASLGKSVSITDKPAIQFYPQLKYREGKTRQAVSVKLNPNRQTIYNFTAAAQDPPVAYLASSTAIFVGRILQFPPLIMLYMARLADLALWIVLMGSAIYFMPRKKWAFAAIGLLPMAVFQAATLNVDVTTVGSMALFFALILNYRERTRAINYKVIIALLILGIIMVLSKQIMFVFLPLVLLLKNRSFKTAKVARAAKAIAITIPLLFAVWWFMIIHNIDVASAYANHQNPHAQIKFIIKNPFSFINVLWNTYFYTWGDSVTRSFIGVFGWSDAPLSELITTIGYVGLAFLVFAGTNTVGGTKAWLGKHEKWLLASIFVVYFAVLSAGFYVYNSPLGFKIIYGLQGRYFLPAALLVLPILPGQMVMARKETYRQVALALPVFLLTTSLVTIYVRYFINNV